MVRTVFGSDHPALVREVRCFRAAIYAEDHVTISEETDEESYHLLAYQDDGPVATLAGCLRYRRLGRGLVQLGGWCVRREARGTRVAVDLVLAAYRLAEELGDTTGVATATTRHGSAQILRKLGGEVFSTYFDPHYGCLMQRLTFRLARVATWQPGLRQAA